MTSMTRRTWLASALAMIATPLAAAAPFRRVRPQYIAVLADPGASAGTGAETWGYWREDPGPIGVFLRQFAKLDRLGFGPTGWRFDGDDWWLDENGIIMKAPDFPMPAGRYLVTNGEENVSILTVEAPDATGAQGWSLSDGMTASDVTHGPCRSARYTPTGESGTCSPADADQSVFPLPLGASPPMVKGCERKEYAVFIVIGLPLGS
jgi:hypothetical protein